MNEASFITSDSTLTSEDRALIADIAKEATKQGWENLLTIASLLLFFVGAGAAQYRMSYLMNARGLRVCERIGSQWFPLPPRPDVYFLDQLLWTTGAFLCTVGLFCAALMWVQMRRTRRLHKLLSRAYPK